MTADSGIAIIGMGCRFPGGAEGLDRYWDLLDGGTDAISGVPSGRWAAGLPYYDGSLLVPGKTENMSGGFLDDIAGWDAALFGVSPAEALRIDPQQRLITEVTWRAVEDAGIGHGDFRAARTGIFAAVTDSQQFTRLEHQYDPPCVDDPFMAVGSSASMAAGRLAFILDTSGPALSIDTACSTSLVALHLAMESLSRGECDLAIVAAASAVIHPESFVAAHQIGMLAPDGRCKAFDRHANGFSIGEGAGAVLLERVRDATANRRRIRAVARGSAVNQNGRSDGITAPQRQAQADVISRALARGAVAAEEVDFVEAHGAGTVLGDAIELEALAEVFGPRDRKRTLHLGAVKTNMGHLLVAAGMAGLIKTVLALEHRRIPPNINFRAPNPILRRTPWMQPVACAVELDAGRCPIAGVSSFGWSGTNAHVVLQAASLRPASLHRATALQAAGPHVLTLAAASARALGTLASELAAHLEQQRPALADVARTLQEGRSWHPVRSAIVCTSAEQAAAACRNLAARPPQWAGREGAARVGLSFPGACEAGPAVVAALSEGFGGFRAAARECRAAFLAASLDPLAKDAIEFTVGYALAAVLRDGGIRPAAIYGTGYLGGCLAGVFSLEHAARMVAASAPQELLRAATSGSFGPPAVPIVCAESGTWLSAGSAQDPEYWARRPGRHAPHGQAVETLAAGVEVIAEACQAGALNGTSIPRQGERPVPVIPLLADPAALLAGIARIWEAGAQVAWSQITAPAGQIVSLPGHPFERRTYWPSAPAGVPAAAESVPGGRSLHCYTRTWRQPVTRARTAVTRPGTAVLFPPPGGVAGDALAGRLRAAGWHVHLASAGLTVPDRAAVLKQAAANDTGLAVIDCSGLGTDDVVMAFSGLMFTCQAISRSLTGRDVALVAAVSGAVEVVGGDAGSVAGGACTGLMSALSAEYPWLRGRVVDIDPATVAAGAAAAGSLADQVLAEIGSLGDDEMGQDTPLVAWRNGRRWVAGWAPAEIPAAPSPWRADGVYVITGGTRGLGMTLAKHIALAGHPKLVLVGRSEFPPRSRWDAVLGGGAPAPDGVRGAIAGIVQIERRGAQVLVLSADVGDPAQMRLVLRSARERYGAVHGIVHCAGVPGSGLLDRKTAAGAAAVISTKTGALTALSEAIQAGGLDFVVLYSSAVTALGGLGETDYAAANACLETFASANSASGTRVIAVSWGPWQHDDWQPAALADAPDLALAIRRYRLESGITAGAGTALLDRLIGVIVPNVLVLSESLEDSRQRWAGLRDIEAMAGVPAADARRPRPDLLAPYVQPGTPLQRSIAGIWQQYLGLEQVGIDDPFFDLGGNSLTGVSMLRRLGRELGLALPPGLLYERPTVRELAAALGDDRRAGEGHQAPAGDGSLRRQLRTEAIAARRRELLIKREAKT